MVSALWRYPVLFLILRHTSIPPLGGGASAQAADPTALVRQFTDAVNRGDASAAAALFSDNANYTGYSTCLSGSKDRAEIVSSIASAKLLNPPETYSVEQVCGDTAAPPAPFNKGGPVHIDTRISLWLSALLAGVVVTVLLSVLVHLFRRLQRPA